MFMAIALPDGNEVQVRDRHLCAQGNAPHLLLL